MVPRDESARLGLSQRLFCNCDLQPGAFHERADRKSIGQPQSVHHEFEHQVVAPDLADFLHRTAFGDPLEIFPGLLPARGPRDAIGKAQLAVGARADAEVIAETPVVEIVAAFTAGLRPGRSLVVRVTARGKRGADGVLHRRRRILVRQRGRMPVEERVRLEREVVERQMRRAGRQRGFGVGARLGERLLGQRDHEVEIDVIEMLLCDIDRAPGFAIVVDASERL